MKNQYTPLTEDEKSTMKSYNIINDEETWNSVQPMVGSIVTKCSGKPFKSLLKNNTVRGIVRNPNTNLWAFSFVEDDSCVDVKQCKLVG